MIYTSQIKPILIWKVIGKYSGQKPLFLPTSKILEPLFLLLVVVVGFFFFFFFFHRKVCNHPHQHHHFHLHFCWVLNFGVIDICFSSKYWVRGLIFCQKVGKGRLKDCVRYIFASLFLNLKESTREARKLFWFLR